MAAKSKPAAQMEADLQAARKLARKYWREWRRWSSRRIPEEVLSADIAANPWLEDLDEVVVE